MSQQSPVEFPGDRRLHVALNTADLDAAERFYRVLLGVEPSKKRPGYIKFEPLDPSVNLTLNEVSDAGAGTRLASHFGIQVKTTDAVVAATERLRRAKIEVRVEEGTTCCYAVQDKVWATDPDGHAWEVFVVLDADAARRESSDGGCCSEAAAEPAESSCC